MSAIKNSAYLESLGSQPARIRLEAIEVLEQRVKAFPVLVRDHPDKLIEPTGSVKKGGVRIATWYIATTEYDDVQQEPRGIGINIDEHGSLYVWLLPRSINALKTDQIVRSAIGIDEILAMK